MKNRIVQETDLQKIIQYINTASTKKQIKEYLVSFDNRDYIFYRIFSLKDETLVSKLPNQLFGSGECRMLFYFFGSRGELYYPSKKRELAHFFRGTDLKISERGLQYNEKDKQYYSVFDIYSGTKCLGYAYTEYYDSLLDWYQKQGEDLHGYNLINVRIPKRGIKKIDFSGAYVKKEDAERLKGSIPVERKIAEKRYDFRTKNFSVKYAYFDGDEIIMDADTLIFDTFKEFATYLNNDLTGGDYRGYNFKRINLNKYDLTDAQYDTSDITTTVVKPKEELLISLKEGTASLVASERKAPIIYREKEYGEYCVYYISDLHIDHKIISRCKNDYDIDKYLCKKINEMITSIENDENFYYYCPLIVVGDVSFSFSLNEVFYRKLRNSYVGDIIVVLGNHELWYEEYRNQMKKYEDLFNSLSITFLNNGLYVVSKEPFISDNKQYYTEHYLDGASSEEINKIVEKSRVVFFGGIGFAGLNKEFNSCNGIYRNAISREQEIHESKHFEQLYMKLNNAIGRKRNVIVITHMPPSDWTKSQLNPNWVYLYGHNHKNFRQNDEDATILADNQIGYKDRKFTLNRYIFDGKYDVFEDFEDGIYDITAEAYKDFCLGKNINMQYTTGLPVIMIKKLGIYLFMRKSKSGYSILNGGVPYKVSQKPQYYFDNMKSQIEMLMRPLEEYSNYQQQYSLFIKSLGGSGKVHGCIVDIDFYNHLYINPVDKTVTPYYATDMIDKLVYHDLQTLLEDHCPNLINNYIQNKDQLPVSIEGNITTPYYDTDIYVWSRKLKAMQYLPNSCVLRCWYDTKQSMRDIIEHNEKYLIENKE